MLTFDDIERLLPNTAGTDADGWIRTTAQSFHDFAHSVESVLLSKLTAGVEVPEAYGELSNGYREFGGIQKKGFTRDQLLQYGASQRLAGRERDGWKWVPVEPTPEMKQVAMAAWMTRRPFEEVYTAMLAASPQEQT